MLRRVLLVQRVSIILIVVEAGAGVSQERRLRLAHLLRVLRGWLRPGCVLLLVERPLLLLHELLLAVGRATSVQVATALIELLGGSMLNHALLHFTGRSHDLERLCVE